MIRRVHYIPLVSVHIPVSNVISMLLQASKKEHPRETDNEKNKQKQPGNKKETKCEDDSS